MESGPKASQVTNHLARVDLMLRVRTVRELDSKIQIIVLSRMVLLMAHLTTENFITEIILLLHCSNV